MSTTGPKLAALLQRLREVPQDFLLAPVTDDGGEVDTVALLGDLLRDRGAAASQAAAAKAVAALRRAKDVNQLLFLHLAVWLLYDPELREAPLAAPEALLTAFAGMAQHAKARKVPEDPERAEELARRVLELVGRRPEGESDGEARARLGAIDSVARAKVLEESRRAHERARQVAEQMRRKAEEEAASKVSRE